MKRALLLPLLLLACIAAAPAPVPAPKVEDIVAGYTKLPRLTKEEVHTVSPQIWDLCGNVGFKSQDEAIKKHGDHAYKGIHVYMNEPGRKAFQQGTAFPVGAVIVKEKNSLALRTKESPRPVALGGMIKRKASSPSNVDNWEFFYIDENKKLATEKDLQRCKDCHTNAAKKDFVFGDWSKVNQPAGAATK